MTVMRQPVSPTVMKATEPPPSLSAAPSLLVGILYISLVLLVQVGHDGLVCLVHRLALILQPFALGIDGGMDGELQRMLVDEVPVTTGNWSSSASMKAPRRNTPMCPVNERAPSGKTTSDMPSRSVSRAWS